MSALQHLKSGDLSKALAALQNDVRNNPADPKLRVFLFQLYAVVGESDRALNQLNVLRDLSKESLTLAQTYQEALQCESFREEVFESRRTPLLFGEPEEWVAMLVSALQQASNLPASSQLRGLAFEKAAAVPGRITFYPQTQSARDAAASESMESSDEHRSEPSDGNRSVGFEWLADADSRLGPVFEAIIHGKYYWVPMNRVRSVTFERVTDLRDLVWLPAKFEWTNGGEVVAFVPTRYAKSSKSSDDAIRLARTTAWTEVDEDTYFGTGLRLLATDQGEYPMTDIAQITFLHPNEDSQ